jgi:hypothetical protein
MQRNLISITLMVAAVLISIAFGSWWLRASVLSPSTSVGATEAILNNDQLRGEITAIVSAATADRLGQPAAEIAKFIEPILASRAGAAVMTDIIAAGHSRVIGENPEPLRITGPQMVQIVRDEVVMDLPPVTIPIAEVTALSTIKQLLWWTMLVPAIMAALALGFAIFARPERRDLQIGATTVTLGIAVSLTLFGLVIPIWGLTALSESAWIAVVSQLATRTLIIEIPVILVFAALGLTSLITTGSRPRRNQWASPISSGRYVSERNWYR